MCSSDLVARPGVATADESGSEEPSLDWRENLEARLADASYAFAADEAGIWQGVSAAQGLTLRAGPDAVVVAMGAAEVDLALTGWGSEDAMTTPGPAAWTAGPCGTRGGVDSAAECVRSMQADRGGLRERWDNGPEGLEQSFEIDAPTGHGDLLVDVSVSGAALDVGEHGARLHLDGGGTLSYAGLRAFDAEGRELPASMEDTEAGLRPGPDGYVQDSTDCDDTHAEAYPGATEVWYSGIDEACDEGDDFDADGDGQQSATYDGDDCDDSNPDVYLGAPDDPYDGVVTDCASAGDYDADADGHTSADYGGDDCDDARSDVYTGAEETWYDGIDQDCDGNDTDQDGDGSAYGDDCDDTDPEITTCDSGETGNYAADAARAAYNYAPRPAYNYANQAAYNYPEAAYNYVDPAIKRQE